jgi:hypothetical protein
MDNNKKQLLAELAQKYLDGTATRRNRMNCINGTTSGKIIEEEVTADEAVH